jgi:hypothetical protein
MKILINKCYGGYGLSEEFYNHLVENKLVPEVDSSYLIARDDQVVVEAAINFGLKEASGHCADLSVVEIPDGVHYSIMEYDGQEWIDQLWIEVDLDELKSGLTHENLDFISKGIDIKLARS